MADETIFGGGKLLPTGAIIPWSGFRTDAQLAAVDSQIIRQGSLDGEWQPGWSDRWTSEGVNVRTERFACEESDYDTVLNMFAKYSKHRKYAELGLESLEADGQEGAEVHIQATYVGIRGGNSWPPDEEGSSNTSADPIETWEGFNTYTGLPDNPKADKVLLDDDGAFKAIIGGSLAGVESYMVPNQVYRRKWAQNFRPNSIAMVGKIYFLTDAPAQNGLWFCSGFTWVRRGFAWICALDFMGTGPNTAQAMTLYG